MSDRTRFDDGIDMAIERLIEDDLQAFALVTAKDDLAHDIVASYNPESSFEKISEDQDISFILLAIGIRNLSDAYGVPVGQIIDHLEKQASQIPPGERR